MKTRPLYSREAKGFYFGMHFWKEAWTVVPSVFEGADFTNSGNQNVTPMVPALKHEI